MQDDDADQVAALDNLSGILQVLARKWLDGRRPYNAIKHGLLISQSNASLRVGLTPESMVSVGHGPSIAYLNHTNWEPQPRAEGTNGAKMRHWTVETQWIRFEEASKIIATACMLIDCMWSLAVARWSQAGRDEVRDRGLRPRRDQPDDTHKRQRIAWSQHEAGPVHRDQDRVTPSLTGRSTKLSVAGPRPARALWTERRSGVPLGWAVDTAGGLISCHGRPNMIRYHSRLEYRR